MHPQILTDRDTAASSWRVKLELTDRGAIDMSDFEELKADLERIRDEIRLKLHLASMDAKDEWHDLEGKWQSFSERAEMHKTAEGLGAALGDVGEELKQAYRRLRKAI
jgi:hypothetical protein